MVPNSGTILATQRREKDPVQPPDSTKLSGLPGWALP